MAKQSESRCPGCGGPLPEPVMCSISHTIRPGAKLCIKCGQRETCQLGWGDCIKLGYRRAEAGENAGKIYREYLKGKRRGKA